MREDGCVYQKLSWFLLCKGTVKQDYYGKNMQNIMLFSIIVAINQIKTMYQPLYN